MLLRNGFRMTSEHDVNENFVKLEKEREYDDYDDDDDDDDDIDDDLQGVATDALSCC